MVFSPAEWPVPTDKNDNNDDDNRWTSPLTLSFVHVYGVTMIKVDNGCFLHTCVIDLAPV